MGTVFSGFGHKMKLITKLWFFSKLSYRFRHENFILLIFYYFFNLNLADFRWLKLPHTYLLLVTITKTDCGEPHNSLSLEHQLKIEVISASIVK